MPRMPSLAATSLRPRSSICRPLAVEFPVVVELTELEELEELHIMM